ncbi:MAG: GNAT family N-acetyltransferase [Anaerolineae bacterium]|nr:GNAT family N-acetyltransferase [Anaerolineae bacterium]
MSSKRNTEPNTIRILPSAPQYAQQMQALMHYSYGTTPDDPQDTMTAEMFVEHLARFREGQFIAVDSDDRVVGLTVSMRMDFNPHRANIVAPWWPTIGYGWLTTHAPEGQWMYGVESCVHPDYRGKGVGSRLMDARFATLRRLNLRGMVAGSAIIDYHKAADRLSPEEYVWEVEQGRIFDTNLTKQLHKGFRVHKLIPNYLENDPTTLGWGVEIVWENPDYRPARYIRPMVAQQPTAFRRPVRPAAYR